jgi:tetratricopeptide (TPR) repeat protein
LDARPWFNLATVLASHLGRYEEAEAAHRRAIELDPVATGVGSVDADEPATERVGRVIDIHELARHELLLDGRR